MKKLVLLLLISFSQNILAQMGNYPGTSTTSGILPTTPSAIPSPTPPTTLPATDKVKMNQSSTTTTAASPPSPTPTAGCIKSATQGQLCGTNALFYCNNNARAIECSNFFYNGIPFEKTGTSQ